MSDFKINNITDRAGSNGPVIAGVSTVSSSTFMVMPSGSTEARGSSGRGIFAAGGYPSNLTSCDLIQIPTTGNGIDFGDLAQGGYGRGSFSSSTRGVVVSGAGPSYVTSAEFVIISSAGGGGNDFGDLN